MKRKKGKSFLFSYLKYDRKKVLNKLFLLFFSILCFLFKSFVLWENYRIFFFSLRKIEEKLVWHSLNEIMTENEAMEEEILMNLLQCCALVAAFITCCRKVHSIIFAMNLYAVYYGHSL